MYESWFVFVERAVAHFEAVRMLPAVSSETGIPGRAGGRERGYGVGDDDGDGDDGGARSKGQIRSTKTRRG